MHVINTFCWITYTYSIPGLLNKNVGTEVAAPGAGNDYGQEKRYHSYYQWVPFVLFLQVLEKCYTKELKIKQSLILGNYVLHSSLDLEELGKRQS